MALFAGNDRYPQESLKQALLDLLRFQITLLLTLWLALAAPITCQYHGLLNLYDHPETANHVRHTLPDHRMDHTPHHTSTATDQSLNNHEMTSGVTLVLSLFVAVAPDRLLLRSSEPQTRLIFAVPVIPQQWVAPPPDIPPRSNLSAATFGIRCI